MQHRPKMPAFRYVPTAMMRPFYETIWNDPDVSCLCFSCCFLLLLRDYFTCSIMHHTSYMRTWKFKNIVWIHHERHQAGVPNYFEKSKAFVYKRIPIYDAATSNLLEFAEDIVNFIATGLCHGSVLVHCQRGVSRSAACALFYLIRCVRACVSHRLMFCE